MSEPSQIERLWCVCSDLLSVIDAQPVGSVKYQGKTFQLSETYKNAISVTQETEFQIFGKSTTRPLSDFVDLSEVGK